MEECKLNCEECGNSSTDCNEIQDIINNPYLNVRFWYQSKEEGYKFSNFVKRDYLKYNGTKHPYTPQDGRVLVMFDKGDTTITKKSFPMDKFEEIIRLGLDGCSMAEVLIGDNWIQLKDIRY